MFSYSSEETFQREIMTGMLNAQEGDYLLWNIERTITKIYIPVLLDSCMNDKGTKDLLTKVSIKRAIICEIIKFLNSVPSCILNYIFATSIFR